MGAPFSQSSSSPAPAEYMLRRRRRRARGGLLRQDRRHLHSPPKQALPLPPPQHILRDPVCRPTQAPQVTQLTTMGMVKFGHMTELTALIGGHMTELTALIGGHMTELTALIGGHMTELKAIGVTLYLFGSA